MTARGSALEFHPATRDRWRDLARLFGPRGACAGCWCMWARLPAAEFRRGVGAPNQRALKRLVDRGAHPGILAYAAGEPVAWVALAPREEYRRLERSRVLAPIDGKPVWSVVPDTFAWTGLAESFRSAGFREAARRSPSRPIMRRTLRARSS